MIKVTIELCPGGDESRARHLGTARISNDLGDTLASEGRLGSYDVELSKWGRPDVTWKRGKVKGFRRQTRGPWDLLLLALLTTVGKRNRGEIKSALEHLEQLSERS